MSPTPRYDSPVVRLAGALAAYVALWFLAPKATFFPYVTEGLNAAIAMSRGVLAVVLTAIATGVFFAPTMAFMAVQFGVVYYFARLKLSFWQSLAALLGFLAIAGGLIALKAADQSIVRIPTVVAVMLAATSIGYLVSLRVTDKNLLLPVVLFAACIDLWTVGWGPVSVMVKKAPEVIHAVSAPIPQAGAGVFIPKFLIGPGDFLFAGLVFAVVNRLKMNAVRTFWFVLAAMILGMLGISLGLLNYFPALILLAAGVTAANWREFKLSKSEMVSVAVVAAVLAATVPLVWSVMRHHAR